MYNNMNEICRLCLGSNAENPVCIYRPASMCRSQATIAKLIENLINAKVPKYRSELHAILTIKCYF